MRRHKRDQIWKGTLVALLGAAASAGAESVIERLTSGSFDPTKEENWAHLAINAGIAALLAVMMYFKGPPRDRTKRERLSDSQFLDSKQKDYSKENG